MMHIKTSNIVRWIVLLESNDNSPVECASENDASTSTCYRVWYVYVHIYIYIYARTHTSIYIYTCVYTYIYVYIHIYTYIYVCTIYMYIYMCIYLCVFTHVQICIYFSVGWHQCSPHTETYGGSLDYRIAAIWILNITHGISGANVPESHKLWDKSKFFCTDASSFSTISSLYRGMMKCEFSVALHHSSIIYKSKIAQKKGNSAIAKKRVTRYFIEPAYRCKPILGSDAL